MNDKRLLVVEDTQRYQSLFRTIGIEAGYEVDIADGELEALEKARCRAYHVALVDIMLQGDENTCDRGGMAVARYIDNLREGTQIVVISASHDVRVPVEALQDAGAIYYIVKADITSSGDILSKLDKAHKKSDILRFGNYNSLIPYLAAPEGAPFFEHHLMDVLGADMKSTKELLDLTFKKLLPVIRKRTMNDVISIHGNDGFLSGLCWSKSLGCAAWVTLGRKDGKYPVPSTTKIGDLIFEREKSRWKMAAWKCMVKREDFYDTMYEV